VAVKRIVNTGATLSSARLGDYITVAEKIKRLWEAKNTEIADRWHIIFAVKKRVSPLS